MVKDPVSLTLKFLLVESWKGLTERGVGLRNAIVIARLSLGGREQAYYITINFFRIPKKCGEH